MVKYRKIPPAAAANQIAENARIPPAADLQKNKFSILIKKPVKVSSRSVAQHVQTTQSFVTYYCTMGNNN